MVGIDGAFVKAGHTRPGQRHQFEILTGRIESSQLGGEAFAVVRDLDPYAKRRVQAILRRCGRGQDTDLRILSDGEDGLRGVACWIAVCNCYLIYFLRAQLSFPPSVLILIVLMALLPSSVCTSTELKTSK